MSGLILSRVRYRYPGTHPDERPTLDGIDLAIEPGRITGITGPNGAGKSTLALVAAGLAPAVVGGRIEGSVIVGGSETRSLPPHELARRCGIVLPDPSSQPTGTTATVWEEIAFGPRNLGLPLDEVIERVDGVLDLLRIRDLAARHPRHLSGGQTQLVGIASVLALRPAFLVLDEPTSELDPDGTALVGRAIRALADAGLGVLLVEHNLDLLADLADDVHLLDDGRIAWSGPARLLAQAPRQAPEPGPAVDLTAIAPAEPPPSIRLEGVTFDYPDGTHALDGIDLEIAPGESIAIVGANGSGKSTLVRHLDGLLRPTRGRVLLDGRDIRDARVAALSRTVGLVFQDPDRQVFSASCRAEAAFGARNVGLAGPALDATVSAALEAVGLEREASTNPYEIGRSRRRLLAIASILAMRSPIVVLDEPTTGQDADGIERVRAVVAALRAQGRTVVAITHDMRFAAECFDRVVVMDAGRIVPQ